MPQLVVALGQRSHEASHRTGPAVAWGKPSHEANRRIEPAVRETGRHAGCNPAIVYGCFRAAIFW
ncbi:hypothetical protein J31TS4_14050 [Paenibacillus sp. J31TS4]|nr:hypothetical protein J31TS4_14050 [Paenibacillus sp. J31TS4]